MEVPIAILIGFLVASGIYLVLGRNLFRMLVGLALLALSANLLVFAAAGLGDGTHVIISETAVAPPDDHPDPLAQAFVLTAIVISFGVLAFCLTLLTRTYRRTGGSEVSSLSPSDP